MIQLTTFVFNAFSENTYIVWDETHECVIIDPGCYDPSEQQKLTSFIASHGLKPVKLLNTHCHIDHVLGNEFVCATYKIPLYMHKDELFTYNAISQWTAMFGLNTQSIPENKVFITEQDTIRFGNTELLIAFTPGHSIASVTFYHPGQRFAFVGDVLFRESIGRTDLPGGNYETLISSIKQKLFLFDDSTLVYSGHGPETTIGYERKNNPFLQ
ncbi:MAG: MBL fold metallo-hydrolase [Bacteroidia bacterium]|jgi:glyoxylase-like metal-dependent hydrolase (beta-lactamase superfamily II)